MTIATLCINRKKNGLGISLKSNMKDTVEQSKIVRLGIYLGKIAIYITYA